MVQTIQTMIDGTVDTAQFHWQVLQLMVQKRQWAACLKYAMETIDPSFLPPLLRSIGDMIRQVDQLEEARFELNPVLRPVEISKVETPKPALLAGDATCVSFTPHSIEEAEKQHVLATLEFYRWNKSQTAKTLQIERSPLDRKLKAWKIQRPDV